MTARFDHIQYIPVLSREFGFTFDGSDQGYSDELGRLLFEAGGWGTTLLYRRSCPGGHWFGSLFSGLLRSVARLIRRGAVNLGKRALTTGAHIAGDVVAGKNVKKAAKRRAMATGRNMM